MTNQNDFKNLSVRGPVIDVIGNIRKVKELRSDAAAIEEMANFYLIHHPAMQKVQEALEEARAEALKKSNPAPASKGLIVEGVRANSFKKRFYNTHNPLHTDWGEA